MKKVITLYLIIFCSAQLALGQTVVHHSLKSTIAAIDTLHKKQAIEKLYIQTDKPYYAFGDTIRFKAYLLDESLSASVRSGLFYVELVDDSSLVVKRQVIMLHNGIAWGDIVVKDNWYDGDYTLRAYTNWMKNFGQEHFFTRRVSIVAGGKHWLVNNQVSIDKAKNVNLVLRFSDLAHRNISFRDIRVSVLQGEHTLLKQKVKTSLEGRVDISFPLPEKRPDEALSVVAEEITKDGYGTPISIPISLNRPEHTDLQFMPEGGNLVAGIASRVGFKAIGEDGLGVDINGKIYNSKQQVITTFQSAHNGMGSFELIPQTGESYVAKVILTNDSVKTYPLPLVHSSGITLRVDNNKDSLEITLNTTADLSARSTSYYLIAQARDKALYGSIIGFKDGVVSKKIAKNIFPTGIAKWVLLDAENHPVAQRLIFINHDDLLNISLGTDKTGYGLRDSMGVKLVVTDKEGKPVQGDFSLAVTDDSRVKPFDEDGDNILSNMLLNGDVKGNIEQPGYYFNTKHPDRDIALDNLLLTQGWTGYDWAQLFAPVSLPEYKAESEYTVSGRASNILGLPVSNTKIMLMSTRSQLLMNAQTDKHGRFTFNGFPDLDTIRFHIQPAKTFNIGLKVDEFVPPEFTPVKYPAIPWYINSDTLMVNYVKIKQAEQEEAFNLGKSKLLKEVVIKGVKIDPPPPIIFKMDEEEIRNARKGPKPLSTLHMLMQAEKKINDWRVYLTVDGGPPKYVDHPNQWLYQYNTEDIKSFTIRQLERWKGIRLDIITNSGKGEVASGTKGYDFRPMPISWPHQFYSPRYTVTTPATVKDYRSTIYWAPNILTDANGTAIGSFYSANMPGTYTIIVEGTDQNGNIGYYRKQVKIGPTVTAAK